MIMFPIEGMLICHFSNSKPVKRVQLTYQPPDDKLKQSFQYGNYHDRYDLTLVISHVLDTAKNAEFAMT